MSAIRPDRVLLFAPVCCVLPQSEYYLRI